MIVSVKYQVTALKQVYNMVAVSLRPYTPLPPPEEIERLRAEAELEPQPPTDEERAAVEKLLGPASTDRDEATLQRIFQLYRREMPELFEALKGFKAPGGKLVAAGPSLEPISQELNLTTKQYLELGSPPLFAVLTLSVEAS